jgi:hypothetical protein
MHTVIIGEMIVCEECVDKAKAAMHPTVDPFKVWMKEVDNEVIALCGVSVHELPDVAFRDNFDDDVSPEEMAEIALEEAGWQG